MYFNIAEALLSISLLIGVAVNLRGAWSFFRSPHETVASLGLPVGVTNVDESTSTKILSQLIGVCLVALAGFYLLTALGPLEQSWNVVAAVVARSVGVIFYAWSLISTGGPDSFRKYLVINGALAISHALFLVLSPAGIDSLSTQWQTFHWVGSGL